ncbi:hypothetical protein EJ04DRAFT_528370 [Polyplosphaeria fusca]|uniref:Uncharacterized protein n=1 Tax=Polyplosphaeria fusca TaxID=682080 RepID=A0A9P4QQ07_9PLEO|nr:hypothetical protein EJ04DRAFT_528370 [Polyplosphaeria fusca]
MAPQNKRRGIKRKKDTENPPVTTPGQSGGGETMSSGSLLELPNIPDDLSIPTTSSSLDRLAPNFDILYSTSSANSSLNLVSIGRGSGVEIGQCQFAINVLIFRW